MNHTLLVKKDYLKEIAPLSKVYAKGDQGEEMRKIKEWLTLWQLNMNDVDLILDIADNCFNQKTQDVVIELQKFLDLPTTGIVDAQLWDYMIDPLKKAFSMNYYNHTQLAERVKYFATKHLQFRSSELIQNNYGPWIRSYMEGKDGPLAYWCQGFVCTILDQAFSSFGKRFDKYYAHTDTCEVMIQHARNSGLLVTADALLKKQYIPKIGDIVLFIERKSQVAHHVEIIYEILDPHTGVMLTIGGNTNFIGSRDGVGTFLVNRNFLTGSKLADVEVVKMLDLTSA